MQEKKGKAYIKTKLGVLEQVQTDQRGNYVKTRIYHLQWNFFEIVI